mmetsp:Transcript_12913/g.26001  ORF Transcript_12913/g.26001 Transcript_12913/m.26001 type:complete len:96 (+) Transcript_12913:64-351(+)
MLDGVHESEPVPGLSPTRTEGFECNALDGGGAAFEKDGALALFAEASPRHLLPANCSVEGLHARLSAHGYTSRFTRTMLSIKGGYFISERYGGSR